MFLSQDRIRDREVALSVEGTEILHHDSVSMHHCLMCMYLGRAGTDEIWGVLFSLLFKNISPSYLGEISPKYL